MAQIKIYGLKENINKNRKAISKAIHDSVITALEYPVEKKFHRFISLEKENFIFSKERTDNYIIIEISMFEGRSKAAKKKLIQTIFTNIKNQASIHPNDVEITIIETPKENWGIRGFCGDELKLKYKVDV
ncbi:MAG: tautomerase family protein [Spirochaetia bacterium]|nr:tautomerase family protein [Spirochaetia bacterium]